MMQRIITAIILLALLATAPAATANFAIFQTSKPSASDFLIQSAGVYLLDNFSGKLLP